ncbi:Glutamyl-tRNA(Gln) amidotransferase subunit A [Pseudocercospora fuligena]|uniref:Glutamyl-tRNA(Gln) amidotransferase subunit A n=1 Tax=Pseudocercospora fuligena TaxID=685502 RepID=A0A8H6R7L3_9PEZI|nr:Glutamyl-tRNA(Gln) amidotransferase subunit A [Pseudocercospora fuligena]
MAHTDLFSASQYCSRTTSTPLIWSQRAEVLSLAHSQPTVDAPSVIALKKAGAIILGKANLHELALEGISVSSLGGQTINPYDYTRTPGGSSGGSAAAVAASFAVFATGSDTVNSLRSPASPNSLFSCRPTKGLISRTGIIPCSYTQDTIGPICRNVKDIATALTVMASVGFDSEDNTTALTPAGIQGVDFSANLENGSLKGLRLGLLNSFMNHTSSSETSPVNKAMASITDKLRSAGATIVNITDKMYNTTDISNRLDTQIFELRENLNAYLERPSLHGQHPNTTNELFASHDFPRPTIPIQLRQNSPQLLNFQPNPRKRQTKLRLRTPRHRKPNSRPRRNLPLQLSRRPYLSRTKKTS